jgi:hypothetical protein
LRDFQKPCQHLDGIDSMLTEDFASWTEKTRRKLWREMGESGKRVCSQLPPGVPMSLCEAVNFIDSLLASGIGGELKDKAIKWREKLLRVK